MSHRNLTHDAHAIGAKGSWARRTRFGWPLRCEATWIAVRAAIRRHRSRRQIGELDARTLKDIGITFAEAEAEANKPFWRS